MGWVGGRVCCTWLGVFYIMAGVLLLQRNGVCALTFGCRCYVCFCCFVLNSLLFGYFGCFVVVVFSCVLGFVYVGAWVSW